MKILLSLLMALAAFVPASYGADKPNIVLINADDLGWAELGCYGQQKIKTPNLDRLATQGQRWTQFYSGAPVCSPSRNVLMTGRHTGGTDVQNLKRVNDSRENFNNFDSMMGDWPISKDAWTLPEALNKIGYTTGVFGKWGLGDYGTSGAPDKHGIDQFYGYTDQKICHTYYPPYLWNNGVKEKINDPGIPGHAPRVPNNEEVKAENYQGQDHSSELIIDRAIRFVDEQAGRNKPFFLYYAPLEPHVAMQPLQKWVDIYPLAWDKNPYRGGGYLPYPRPRAGYAGMISQMDHNVGRLIDALKAKGFDKNTIIIFTSDNGTTHDVGGVDHRFFNSVSNLRGLKGQMYEGGLRVPGIMVWPGKIKPGVIDQPAYHADIMPTLCVLTGADPGKPYGENLIPILSGKEKALPNRKPLVWAGGGYTGQVAVRIGDKKAIRRKLLPNEKPTNWEVYDLVKDPAEKTNLAESEKDVIEKAKAILEKEYTPAKGFPRLRYDAPKN